MNSHENDLKKLKGINLQRLCTSNSALGRLDYFHILSCYAVLIHRFERCWAAALMFLSCVLVMASDTGVMGGAGVVEREGALLGAALRLCAM